MSDLLAVILNDIDISSIGYLMSTKPFHKLSFGEHVAVIVCIVSMNDQRFLFPILGEENINRCLLSELELPELSAKQKVPWDPGRVYVWPKEQEQQEFPSISWAVMLGRPVGRKRNHH